MVCVRRAISPDTYTKVVIKPKAIFHETLQRSQQCLRRLLISRVRLTQRANEIPEEVLGITSSNSKRKVGVINTNMVPAGWSLLEWKIFAPPRERYTLTTCRNMLW